jgi:hypothetical protein
MDGPVRRFGEFPWRDACQAAGVGKPSGKVRVGLHAPIFTAGRVVEALRGMIGVGGQ